MMPNFYIIIIIGHLYNINDIIYIIYIFFY